MGEDFERFFRPPPLRTEKFLATAANGEKNTNFLVAAADEGIGLHL